MLPSLGFNEIVILAVLALLVVGPKDLPLLFRKIGRWTAKLRGMAQEFRTGFDELARQAELDELKREVDALRRTTNLQDIGRELSTPLPTLEDYAKAPTPTTQTSDTAAVQGEAPALSQEPEPASLAGGAHAAPPEPAPMPFERDDSHVGIPAEEAHDKPMARSAP